MREEESHLDNDTGEGERVGEESYSQCVTGTEE